MTKVVETRHPEQCIVSEEDNFHCREVITIGESQTLLANSVVGLIGTNEGAITVAAPVFAGTGNGVMTLLSPADPFSATVQEGAYKVVLIEATANGGTFEIRRPDGTIDGTVNVGVAYAGQIKFTIADGATDFAPNDTFTVTVTIAEAAAAGQYKVFDPAATNGLEVPAAIIRDNVTTGVGATKKVTAWVRGPCTFRASDVYWPAGISAPNKAAAIASFAARGMLFR